MARKSKGQDPKVAVAAEEAVRSGMTDCDGLVSLDREAVAFGDSDEDDDAEALMDVEGTCVGECVGAVEFDRLCDAVHVIVPLVVKETERDTVVVALCVCDAVTVGLAVTVRQSRIGIDRNVASALVDRPNLLVCSTPK